MKRIKFLAFADLHYKKKMYAVTVSHLERILARAEEESCDLILHAGDFCNDYQGSPEVVNPFLGSRLPVFGVYGNHELESRGNSMENVTPCLTNRSAEVCWGSASGRMEADKVGYYYYDREPFRFVFLDTNYSLAPDGKTYEHNGPASWGKPDENTASDSLGGEQLLWLERVLTDAAEKALRCIVVSHTSFVHWGIWEPSADADAVRELFCRANAQRAGTVLMSINGHFHTDHAKSLEDVVYFDLNAAVNGWWQGEKFDPYGDGTEESSPYTFPFVDYDGAGNPVGGENFPLARLKMGRQTLFFEEPLSAVITVWEDGRIEIAGSRTRFLYDICNAIPWEGCRPSVEERAFSVLH